MFLAIQSTNNLTDPMVQVCDNILFAISRTLSYHRLAQIVVAMEEGADSVTDLITTFIFCAHQFKVPVDHIRSVV